MKAQLVCYGPTESALAAGVPVLTPEMTTAVSARYSRNDGGLEEILKLLENKSQDATIDSIFRMVDYGHASIADMAPVAIFIDGISIWLAYYLWSVCPRASGQETSTRYVKFGEGGILTAAEAGISKDLTEEWNNFISQSIQHYNAATACWEEIANTYPELVRIPEDDYQKSLIEGEEGHKARLKVNRLKRNFVFDRARYFIPVAAKTNTMMVMPARDWVELVRNLSSHYILEAQALATQLYIQLKMVVPRLMKHSEKSDDRIQGHLDDLEEDATMYKTTPRTPTTFPNIYVSVDQHCLFSGGGDIERNFRHHTNRYARIGRRTSQIFVRYGIIGVAMAELRDLNRHRTGSKYAPSVPMGFYSAEDQIPEPDSEFDARSLWGYIKTIHHHSVLLKEDKSHPYWGLLGTQYLFEHCMSLDKLAYVIALRSGSGSHFRYHQHMINVHDKLIEKIPELKGKILVGSAEPE